MTTNPNTPEFETADALLTAYEQNRFSLGEINNRKNLIRSLKQSMRVMILNEVIGEDIEHIAFCNYKKYDCTCGAHEDNMLRATQRQRLDQALTKFCGEG